MSDPYSRAQGLIGCKFRPQGRNAETGLDCVGVVILAFDIRAAPAPSYRCSGWDWSAIGRELGPWFAPALNGCVRRNQLVIFDTGRTFHFGVTGERSFVHADLRFRQVVEQPFDDVEKARFFVRKSEQD